MIILFSKLADVVELADTLDSGSSSVKRVQVQVLSSAPQKGDNKKDALRKTPISSGFFAFLEQIF